MSFLKSLFSSSAKAIDPKLDALFTSSVGPVEPEKKPKYEGLLASQPRAGKRAEEAVGDEKAENNGPGGGGHEGEMIAENGDSPEEGSASESEALKTLALKTTTSQEKASSGKRKRKTKDEDDDLEGKYLDKLAHEATRTANKRRRKEAQEDGEKDVEKDVEGDGDSSEDGAGSGSEPSGDSSDEDGQPMVHESLVGKSEGGSQATDGVKVEQDKAARTIFLSNVSLSAITSKSAKKTLLAHLGSVLDAAATDPAETVESLRFRSVPFATAALPKRAAFITKSVMGATAQSTNAYAVYSTAAAARQAVRKLNGTVVLDRHLRVDSIAHPSPVDHRRCVFVGNLGFVDDETLLDANGGADGEEGDGTPRIKKRNKVPMDVEEGLWRVFGQHAGKVESVRVVRDQTTRVGKGIAYVQFYDGIAVESALLLSGKKYPPLLPRELRVSRCKAPHKTARAAEHAMKRAAQKSGKKEPRKPVNDKASAKYAPKVTAEQQTQAGRAVKWLGQSATRSPLVFEGARAQAGHSNVFKHGKGAKGKGKGKGKGQPGTTKEQSNNKERRARRAAGWKEKGGKISKGKEERA